MEPPAETIGPENSVDSVTVSCSAVEKEAVKECVPALDSSRLSSPTVGVAASLSPSHAEKLSTREASPERDDNNQVGNGSGPAAAAEQETAGGATNVVAESTALDGSPVDLPSVGIGGDFFPLFSDLSCPFQFSSSRNYCWSR